MALVLITGCATSHPGVQRPLRGARLSSLAMPRANQGASPSGEADPSQATAEPALPAPGPEPIQVLGGVTNPGQIPYQKGADLSFYLAKAGADGANAMPEKVQIIRGKPGKKKASEFELKHPETIPALQSGDILIVHTKKPPMLERALAYAARAAALVGAVALFLFAV